MEEGRYKREAEFHDKVFSDDTRQPAYKYYSIAQSSKAFYRNYIIAQSRDGRVLEYGCGPFSHAPLLAQQGAAVVGIDISPVAVARHASTLKQKNVHRALSCVMNAESLGFREQSFNLICGIGILHHLNLEKSLDEIARTLSPGGSAIFLEPLGHNPLINAYRHLTPKLRTVDEHPLTVADLELMKRYFGCCEIVYFHLMSLLAVPFRSFRWFPKVVNRLEAVDRWIFRTIPYFRRWSWAAVMILREPKHVAPAPSTTVTAMQA